MPRARPEWIGASPDTKIPPRVRLRIFERENGVCHLCKQRIQAGERWEANHDPAIIAGGQNRESMIFPAHVKCHKGHTKQATAEKAKVAAIRQRHLGIVNPPKMQSRGFDRISAKTANRKARASSKLPLPGPSAIARRVRVQNGE